jgi:hypothetical protein
MCDILTMIKTSQSANFIVKDQDQIVQKIRNLTEADVRSVMSAYGKTGPSLGNVMMNLSSAGQALFNILRKTSQHVPGSRIVSIVSSFAIVTISTDILTRLVQAKSSQRSQALAGSLVYGHCTVMINICHSEVGNKFIFEMGSPKIVYTFEAGTGNPVGRPSKTEALKYVSNNPYACVWFHRVLIEGFHAKFLGWPLDKPRQIDPECMFNVLTEKKLCVEESGRTGLHSHSSATQPVLANRNLVRLFAEEQPAIKQCLLGFCESIQTSAFPTVNIGDNPSINPKNDKPIVKWDERSIVEVMDLFHNVIRECNLDTDTEEQILSWAKDCIKAVNLHWHRDTCKKNGCRGDDLSCRMEYLRLLISMSHFVKEKGTDKDSVLFLLHRSQGNIVPFILALMIALPGNHTMSLTGEISRWARQIELHNRMKKANPASQAEPPPMPDSFLASFIVTSYICSYNFKADAVNVNLNFLNISKVLQDITKTPIQASRSVVKKCLNQIHGSVVSGSILQMWILLFGKDYIMSYDTKIHNWKAYAQILQPIVAEEMDEGRLTHHIVIDSCKNVSFRNDVDNYLHRSSALSMFSPIEVSLMFKYGKASTQEGFLLRVQAPHPDADTHGHVSVKRGKMKVPQFISNTPFKPTDPEDKDGWEKYAAYALSNYYPDRECDLAPILVGKTKHEKLKSWLAMPSGGRGGLDNIARYLLENSDLMAEAKQKLKAEGKRNREERRALKLFSQEQEEQTHAKR